MKSIKQLLNNTAFAVGLLLLWMIGVAWAADTKLSALTELAAAPAGTDQIYINDGGTSKRITVANLIAYITGTAVDLGTPSAIVLTNGTGLTGSGIENDSIDSEHYADGSIDAAHLAADVIDETKIADNGIDSEHYNDGSIDAVHLNATLDLSGKTITLPQNATIASTSTVNGLVKAVSIGNCEGAHDGAGNAATLSDSGESLTVDAYIGMTLYNITDGSSCTITDNNATTITCTLSGGTDDDWDASDVWQVGPGPAQSGSVFYISSATTIAHPATAGFAAGYFVAGAVVVKVDPYSDSMTINFSDDGTSTDPGAGDEIDGDGTQGDFIWIHNASTTEAYSHGVNGSWADGGAS